VTARRAGVNLPLFSGRSTASWGIGELPDIVPLSRWLADAGFTRLLLLPLGTVRAGETSPYSATSTMSIDPIYIAVENIQDFERAGGVGALSEEATAALTAARHSPVLLHEEIRRAKEEALSLAFSAFQRDEWEQLTTRAAALAGYISRERWWLDDYALFQALTRSMPGVPWRAWPDALRDRDPRALDDARRRLAAEVLAHQYWQWIAEEQWRDARARAAEHGVGMVGDLPFVPNMESPEVWSRADEFMLDVSAGVPPDAFSATGQDWGLPTYRWSAIEKTGYGWIHQRARRMAALYEGLRVDHVIGLFRTYGRPRGGEPFFNPSAEPAQRLQGETILTTLLAAGIDVIAEDLGVVPDFLRVSLKSLGVPGCKVIRWERDWHTDGQPFIDPEDYPAVSVAMTGTHDTEPLAVWWATSSSADRRAFVSLPIFVERRMADPDQPWSEGLRDLFIEIALRAGSRDVFLPMQDLFGWPDRVNVPGTVGPQNWTWTLPWAVDRLGTEDVPRARAAFLRTLALAAGRRHTSDYTKAG